MYFESYLRLAREDLPGFVTAAGSRDRRLPKIVAAALTRQCPAEEEIARVRAQLIRRDESGGPDDMTVGEHALQTSVPPRWGTFLYALTNRLESRSVLEMGTSVGVSGSYLASALCSDSGGRLLTLEGNPVVADVARETFASLRLTDRAEVRTGSFTDTLAAALVDAAPVDLMFIDGHHREEPTLEYFEQALPHLAEGAVIVFDDIRWSDGMRRAWTRLQKHERTKFAVSIQRFGLWGG